MTLARHAIGGNASDVLRQSLSLLGAHKRQFSRRGAAYVKVGKGEPLVLLHGVGMRLEAWAPQIMHFAQSHTVIAVDMPGHGESAALPIGSNLRDFVSWLGKFLDDLELAHVNVAGHSMGALIAGGAAAALENRLTRVACVNGTYRRSMTAKRAVMERAAAIWTDGVDPDGPMARWFDDAEDSRYLRETVHKWLAEIPLQSYAIAYTAFATGDELYADAWPEITIPALFLTGEHDPNSTPEMARQMAEQAPCGQLVVVEEHKHMVNLTAPYLVNSALGAWLATTLPQQNKPKRTE